MGRSYWFECSRCGYRTAVSGRADRGPDFYVETIQCFDCRQLYDAVVRQRIPAAPKLKSLKLQPLKPPPSPSPPMFQAALNKLPIPNLKNTRWVRFKLMCPVSSKHRFEKWKDPGPCPRCGVPIEKNPLPYRIWE
jgi:hypothetical protein